ncbi:methylated-DNA--[protein]-cysteine S-methyltransferase [Desulfosarcina sp.]|uniref:methylated-DNA--[protein]-cysteine S-methyltransferase n=1 Tax=Desulfosarcina sp. TaxID=2027861 RepID=UPI003970B364
MIYDTLETDLAGILVMAADAEGLRHLNFLDGKHPLTVENTWRRDPDRFTMVKNQLSEYFAGKRKTFDVNLFAQGSPFQMKVWSILLTIPYGTVVSYQWVARRIGSPEAARAVGTANGRNPIAIIIPCHRVIGKHGHLTGFGGGLEVKRKLIRLENPTGCPARPLEQPFKDR